MKKIIIFLISISFSLYVSSQQYENFYIIKAKWDAYYDSIINIRGIDSMQGTGYNPYKRWVSYWEPLLYPSGDYDFYKQKFMDYVNEFIENDGELETEVDQLDWELIGPVKMPDGNKTSAKGLGQIHYIAFDPNDTTHNKMFACSPVGGLWRSTDHGENWTNAGTDKELPKCGVSSVAIDENNSENNLFISTGCGEGMPYHEWWQKAIGVWRTIDGGQNWVCIGLNSEVIDRMRKIIKLPSSSNVAPLMVVTNLGVYKCDDAFAIEPQWNLIVEGDYYDIELHPNGNQHFVYVSGTQSSTVIVINYIDNSYFTLPNLGFLPDPDPDENIRRILIENSPVAENFLFIVVSYDRTPHSFLYRYDLSNNNSSLIF